MESIAHPIRESQPRGNIKAYPFGIHIESPLKGVSITGKGGGGAEHLRGEIVGFSAASRARMRKAMLTRYIEGAYLVGSTFTVPWKGTNFVPLMDEFRECWHRFAISFRRACPHSAAIYRVELQERGAPHIHALIWLANEDAAGVGGAPVVPLTSACVLALADLTLRDMWLHSVPNLHRGSYRAFCKYGARVEAIPDAGAMFRYLADHASKHKQAQLGYKGKQWGIIGEANLATRQPVSLPPFVSPKHEAVFLRLLRKVMRYRLRFERHKWKRYPPFGSVLKGSRRVVGDFYLRQDTALRMFEHALEVSHGCA